MYNAKDLYNKLGEIEKLIGENTSEDGSLAFDPYPVIVSLELARRLIVREEIIE